MLASDSSIRKVISEALRSAGYVVVAAKDMGDAMDWLKNTRPGLLMIRHDTDFISGHDAAMYLSKKCPGVPVLLVGGLMAGAGLEDREHMHGFEIFPKPFDAAELVETVKEVIAKHPPRSRAN